MSGDGYASPIAGGDGTLVREQLRSINYAAGVAGWRIGADGSAEFNDVVIRGDLQSDNWVAGTTGWKLDDTGSAEFNGDLTARGTFRTAPLLDDRVELAGLGGADIRLFNSHDAATNADGSFAALTNIYNAGSALSSIRIAGTIDTAGQGAMTLIGYSPKNNANPGIWEFNKTVYPGPLTEKAEVRIERGLVMRVREEGAVTLAGNGHGFGIENGISGQELCADPFGLQSRDGGVKSTLKLNPLGGGVIAPDMAGEQGTDTTGRSTTSTAYVSASSTAAASVPYPPSGRALIMASTQANSAGATSGGLISFEVRDTNSAGTLRLSATDVGAGRISGTDLRGTAAIGIATGLPTTGTMFVRPMFRSTSGVNAATFDNIVIAVVPLL